MLKKSVIENLLEVLSAGGVFAEVFDEETQFNDLEVRKEGLYNHSMGQESGVGLRIIEGLYTKYAFTNDKSEQALMALAQKLVGTKLNTQQKGIKKGQEIRLNPCQKHEMNRGRLILPSDQSIKERIQLANRGLKSGLDFHDDIAQMQAKILDFSQRVCIANSEGLHVTDERIKTRLFLMATAQNGNGNYSGYYGPGAMQGFEFFEGLDIEWYGMESARIAKTMLDAPYCSGGQMSVVVNNGFGGLMFHEACGHSLEASSVAKGASEFSGKLGQKVASEKVTLIDDGSMENEWGSLHVDDEGTPTQKNVLIEKGILKSYLVDKLGGKRMNMPSTGSARRQNYRFAPVARMNNTYIAPGEEQPETIIGDTEKGLYVKYINGGSVDPSTGDFNFNAAECYLIEKGKLTTPVKGVTLIGNGLTLLKSIDRVGNDFDLRQGYCYAGSGALFIGAGQPTVRVKNMTVGGVE